jgi:hypothetical protein
MFFRARKSAPPPMTLEGALGPNDRLDAASAMPAPNPDALAICADGALLFSSGASVLRLRAWGQAPEPFAEFEAPVTALASSPGGRVAAGLSGGALRVLDAAGHPLSGWNPPAGLKSIVDAMFLSDDDLVLVDHGYAEGEPMLPLATWDQEARGRIAQANREQAPRFIAERLWCPMSVARDAGGELLFTEFERARIVDIGGHIRQSGYPGYLGRLRKSGSGFLLACLSRRDALIEFLKTERAFVEDMKARVAPSQWIAPRLDPGFRHDFPIELGATRLFGEVKPWAPSFSYGLLIELDASLAPLGSAQSRAHGRRHGVSDALDWNGEVIAVSKASEELLKFGRSEYES